MIRKTAFIALWLLCLSASVGAAADGKNALPVPRFVTLATDEVNLRAGPGLRYPIRYVIRRDGLPVEVIREFDVWRQIRDIEGDEGWVHKSMLSGRRAVIVKNGLRTMVRKPGGDRPVARLEPGVIASLGTCKTEWCRIEIGGYDGWLPREDLWGVYPDEQFGE